MDELEKATTDADAKTNDSSNAPNILFAVVDSLRADAVFGPDSCDTPTLDSLAADGLAFERCFSQGISTGPSMTAMLTGRYPLEYGGHWYLAEDQPTFAEQFRAAGYRTGAIHSNPYVASGRNFDRGFDEVREDIIDFEPDHQLGGRLDKLMRLVARANRLLQKTPYTPITEVNDHIEDWVDTGDNPFLLWTQYMDVHGPYLPGGEFSYYNKLRAEWLWRKAAVRNPEGVTEAQHTELQTNYHEEIEFFDRRLGNLLDTLDKKGVLEDTVVVVVGDHGDEFDEHGWYGHCNLPYDELTHVPLIVRFPEDSPAFQGQRVERMVRCVDILPTVADYTGVEFSDRMRGRLVGESLRPLIADGTLLEFNVVVTEKRVWSGSALRFGFRTNEWKFLYDGTDETAYLYDLQADPEEMNNVIESNPEVAARFRNRLEDRVDCLKETAEDVTIPDLDQGLV